MNCRLRDALGHQADGDRYHESSSQVAALPVFATGGILRTCGNPMALAGAIRSEVRDDRSVPFLNIREFGFYFSESFAQRRLVLAVLSSLAGIALFLAAFGICSVVAYAVTLGTQEIGPRVASGARRSNILKLVPHAGKVDLHRRKLSP